MPQLFTNNASAPLASSIVAIDTSLSVGSGQGAKFPSLSGPDTFTVTVTSADGTVQEIMLVTARATDALTVTRAQEGTSASPFTAGAVVEVRLTASWLNSVSAFLVNAALAAIAALTPAADKFVYFTSASAAALGTVTSFARTLLDDTDAATARTTLGAAATSGHLGQFAATTSAQLAGVMSDETGSGALVFGTGPTLSNPIVGTQSPGDNSTKGASTAYVDAAVAAGTIAALDDIGDVDTSGVSDGDVLTFDSGDWVASPPAATGPSRANVTKTTASLANNATENSTVTLAKTSKLISIEADRAARVAFYSTSAARTADSGRAIGTPATPGTGVLAEFVLAAATPILASPSLDLVNGDVSPTTSIYYAITNISGSTHTVQIDLIHLALEA